MFDYQILSMKILKLTLICLALVGCKSIKDLQRPDALPEIQQGLLPVNISLSLATRVSDTSYDQNDQVGLYMVYGNEFKSSDNYVDNKKYTLEGTEWIGEGAAYWKDHTTPASFYCYYPYTAPENPLAYEYSVSEDQSDLYEYKASDFLWGCSLDLVPQKGSIPLSTTHIMSNIVIELVPGAGFTQEEFMTATKSVAIGNVKNNALINLSTGGVTAVGEPTSIKTYKDGDTYKAIIVPQSVAADADMLIITVADVVYTSKETFTFKSMTKHQFTVFVDKTAAGLDITVEDWIIDEENHTATVS